MNGVTDSNIEAANSGAALLFEKHNAVARLVINRPDAMNALNNDIVNGLSAALDSIEADRSIRVVLITGSGRAFCAGADLKDAQGRQDGSGENTFLQRTQGVFERISNFPKPVIAVLNGITLAGGLELAMCTDLIIAAENAKIGDGHANFAAYPGAGSAAVLPRLVPLPTALYMLFTGKTFKASRLMELGLVCEVHPADQLQQAALDLGNLIATKSPSQLRRVKVVARASQDKSRVDALLHEKVMMNEHMNSADFKEGLSAFVEKRAPNYTGD